MFKKELTKFSWVNLIILLVSVMSKIEECMPFSGDSFNNVSTPFWFVFILFWSPIVIVL